MKSDKGKITLEKYLSYIDRHPSEIKERALKYGDGELYYAVCMHLGFPSDHPLYDEGKNEAEINQRTVDEILEQKIDRIIFPEDIRRFF